MRRLYIGPGHDVVRMESVCDVRPRRDCACHVWLDSRHRASGHAPVIRISTWPDLLYSLGPVAGHLCIHEPLCLYLYDEIVWAGDRLELSFCPGHVVVSQPHYVLLVRAQVPHHRIAVAVYASGNFWLGARGRIPWLPGH